MSELAIQVEHVGKRYRIGTRERYRTFRDTLTNLATRPLRAFSGGGRMDQANSFWALKDVCFEVKRGEVVGIIGRNGAGKSTLLKILSRITEPTEGQVTLEGRVGSLLEVGTGFHPELTGRENIYLNGAILGMTRAEIAGKFDEIVDFSEIAKFLDTPVKQYSSGMYTRLAFAVAANLEPEILIVDEVLAVGDAAFQKKCLGKMQDVAGQGRTVLFVSHNMNAISTLCRSAVLLDKGRVELQGEVEQVVRAYSDLGGPADAADLAEHSGRAHSREPALRRIALFNDAGDPASHFAPQESAVVRVEVEPGGAMREPRVSLGITNWRGERLFAVASFLGPDPLRGMSGHRTIEGRFVMPALIPGTYTLDIALADGSFGVIDAIYGGIAFDVRDTGYLGTSHETFREMGHLMVRSQWEVLDATPRPATPSPAPVAHVEAAARG